MQKNKSSGFSSQIDDSIINVINNSQVEIKDLSKILVDGYLTYALSVIIGRALPDVRDGLKPSQRRIIYAMLRLGLSPTGKTRKCAKVCGDTSGDYHPHGELVIYPTLVRMAQNWVMRYPLIIGQGNFGSVDGDDAAAMRYTEAKLSPVCMKLIEDLDKDTVEMQSNYDGTKEEPTVFPAAFPNVICNGASGIAVGMATSIPPHNMQELFHAVQAILENREIPDQDLLTLVHGPDFPSGGYIRGIKGIQDLYLNGYGKITLCGEITTNIERGILQIVSIPYGITKSKIVLQIAENVQEKRITDVTDIRDESDKNGLCISIAMRNGADPDAVIAQLYKYTDLQISEGYSFLVIDKGKPIKLTLKGILCAWIDHRHDVILQRTCFEKRQAELRKEILTALLMVLKNMQQTINLIKSSQNKNDAKSKLQLFFDCSERQALAILDMKLYTITNMESSKIEKEHQDIIEKINYCDSILLDPKKVDALILNGMQTTLALHKKQDSRLTTIKTSEKGFEIEDAISNIVVFITISKKGYTKRMNADEFREQKRGGFGVRFFESKTPDDFVCHLCSIKLKETLLLFTNKGKVFSRKAWYLPTMGKKSQGKHINIILDGHLDDNESILAILPITTFNIEDAYIILCTKNGIMKRTALRHFSNIRKTGIISINLDDDDDLIQAALSKNKDTQVMMFSKNGMGIRFDIDNIRETQRNTRGVRGMSLKENDKVVSCEVVESTDTSILLLCSNGYGKRSKVSKFRATNRGGIGVRGIITNKRNGSVVKSINLMQYNSIVIAVSNGNTLIVPVHDMRDIGRTTQGIRIAQIPKGEHVVSIAGIPNPIDPDHETTETKMNAEHTPIEKTIMVD